MQSQKAERGPRGRYARTICRGCRSRKIKCVMQNRGDLGPLGVPQPPEKSCERCRNLNLECIFERTFLGRPAAKRLRGMAAQENDTVISAESDRPNGPVTSTLSSVDIQDHLFSDAAEIGPNWQELRMRLAPRPTKEERFRSMIEPHYFLSSVLSKDQAFGSDVTQLPSCWDASLTELIDNDTAESLEKSLTWHYFFHPSMPGLVELRSRLLSNDFTSINPATKLLFALLCLTAIDIDEALAKRHPALKPSLRLAVAFVGQEFIFSPPTHHDTVVLKEWQKDLKKTRNKEVHFHLLHFDTFLDGYLAKSHYALRQALTKMAPVVDVYQIVLKHRQCSPRTIFHINWAMSVYILLNAVANIKERWNNPGSLFREIDEAERRCVEQLKTSDDLFEKSSGVFDSREIEAARSILELRFNSIIARIWGLGLLYASVLKVRSLEGGPKWEHEIESHEAIQISDQVRGSREDMIAGTAEPFAMALSQLGVKFPQRLTRLLELFIRCTDLRLAGTSFCPPLQHLALEVLTHCKNIVENNLVHLKCFGRLNPEFEKQLELFTICAQRFDSMVAAPWTSTDVAFANGCVYAVGSKVIVGFCQVMKPAKENLSRQIERQECQQGEERQAGVGFSPMYSDMSEGTFFNLTTSTEAWNMWPYLGGFDPLPNPLEFYDWIEGHNTDGNPGSIPFL
ncbi:hypothetical protein P168DRAFT_301422 [Aspergillus campestris IBT 28561]|uniref:Zn(2)-C6 fungal-type domain-containing protein n=1 Tax=Aspergillus campestris (strain IBT 28561) TaxID=1392248 RepID=A0A2I1DFZ3_ASPC2|nr:uncharacterized protein P168DRAFT_301422 [Aspergillus campestris IBT 28561]PKY08788.1 hypothetical protein P168DRAFT_301422 [Aspergillus campestris IBT 28561]